MRSSTRFSVPKKVDIDSLEERLQLEVAAQYFKRTYAWTKMNRNRIIIITGDVGSGKSWTALAYMYILTSIKLGHKVRPEEFPFENITFSPVDFLKRVDAAENEIIMFDEAGVGAHARSWYSAANIAISKAAQVFRYKRHILLLTVPRLYMVDKHIRELAHEIHVVTGNIKHGKNLVFIRELVYQPRQEKTFWLYPQFYVKALGTIVQVPAVRIGAPPKWLIEKYESMQRGYKDKVLKETIDVVQELTEGVSDKGIDDAIQNVLNILAQYPPMITTIVSERRGIAKISPSKLTRSLGDGAVPKKYAKIVAERLNELIFGNANGVEVYEYYAMAEDGSLEEKLRRLGKGGTQAS